MSFTNWTELSWTEVMMEPIENGKRIKGAEIDFSLNLRASCRFIYTVLALPRGVSGGLSSSAYTKLGWAQFIWNRTEVALTSNQKSRMSMVYETTGRQLCECHFYLGLHGVATVWPPLQGKVIKCSSHRQGQKWLSHVGSIWISAVGSEYFVCMICGGQLAPSHLIA